MISADAVALLLGLLLERLEALALHELGDDHALVRHGGHHARHHDERVAAQDARQGALVVGLQLVVELLLHPRADLLRHRLHVELGGDAPHQAQDHAEVLHVRAHGHVHARVLHLHGHIAPVVQLRAVDLPDRGGGDRLLVELRERLLQRLAHLLLDHLAHVLEGHLRRGVAQLGELLLELLAVVLGHQAHVEEREHLAELHRGALHRPEHLHDLLGGLHVALLERGRGGLLGPHHVGRLGAGLLHGGGGGRPPDLRQPPVPPGGDSLVGHCADH